MGKKVTLQSGAEIDITPAPFTVSKALYQALLEEGTNLKLDPSVEIDVNFYKDLFCVGFSSKKVEVALWACLERVLYKNLRITSDTFEPIEAREDYTEICFEVMLENILPFTKSLSAQYQIILGKLKAALA